MRPTDSPPAVQTLMALSVPPAEIVSPSPLTARPKSGAVVHLSEHLSAAEVPAPDRPVAAGGDHLAPGEDHGLYPAPVPAEDRFLRARLQVPQADRPIAPAREQACAVRGDRQ